MAFTCAELRFLESAAVRNNVGLLDHQYLTFYRSQRQGYKSTVAQFVIKIYYKNWNISLNTEICWLPHTPRINDCICLIEFALRCKCPSTYFSIKCSYVCCYQKCKPDVAKNPYLFVQSVSGFYLFNVNFRFSSLINFSWEKKCNICIQMPLTVKEIIKHRYLHIFSYINWKLCTTGYVWRLTLLWSWTIIFFDNFRTLIGNKYTLKFTFAIEIQIDNLFILALVTSINKCSCK
jgi:hypothetical protein